MAQRNIELIVAKQTVCHLFSVGAATDIQELLQLVANEIAIHNAASPDNEQLTFPERTN